MSNFVYLCESQELPDDYESYSIFLIPDSHWLDKIGEERFYQLFNRYREFGEAIGQHHLAAWLYTGYDSGGGTSEHFIRDIFSYVSYSASGPGDIARVIKRNCRGLKIGDINGGSYDFIRAKYFCALYRLNFNHGPYIAFFSQKPFLPLIYREDDGTGGWSDKVYTKDEILNPAFILQFDGLDIDGFMSSINTVEYEILRSKTGMRELKIQQLHRNLKRSSAVIATIIGKSFKILSVIKKITGFPDLKDII